jgi:hypothetical protein
VELLLESEGIVVPICLGEPVTLAVEARGETIEDGAGTFDDEFVVLDDFILSQANTYRFCFQFSFSCFVFIDQNFYKLLMVALSTTPRDCAVSFRGKLTICAGLLYAIYL